MKLQTRVVKDLRQAPGRATLDMRNPRKQNEKNNIFFYCCDTLRIHNPPKFRWSHVKWGDFWIHIEALTEVEAEPCDNMW